MCLYNLGDLGKPRPELPVKKVSNTRTQPRGCYIKETPQLSSNCLYWAKA
jgi:hypothetical protein